MDVPQVCWNPDDNSLPLLLLEDEVHITSSVVMGHESMLFSMDDLGLTSWFQPPTLGTERGLGGLIGHSVFRVRRVCEEIAQRYWEESTLFKERDYFTVLGSESLMELQQKYEDEINDYLLKNTRVSHSTRTEILADIMELYLQGRKEPSEDEMYIIQIIHHYRGNIGIERAMPEWYDFCCEMLGTKEVMRELTGRLGGIEAVYSLMPDYLKLLEVFEDLREILQQKAIQDYYQLSKQTNVLIIYTAKDREGAEEEAEPILQAFSLKPELFNIQMEKDQTGDDIIKMIEQSARETERGSGVSPSALIVVIMSHGNVGVINDVNGYPIPLTQIEAAMCTGDPDTLKGKPKILIAQCCQDRDALSKHLNSKVNKVKDIRPGQPNRSPFAPKYPHFCLIMSGAVGEMCDRGIFIPKVAEQIKNWEDGYGIIDLAQRVFREMEREGNDQTPVVYSTLKARYCPLHSQETNTEHLYGSPEWQDSSSSLMHIMLRAPSF